MGIMGGVVVVICNKKWKLYFHSDPEFWSKLSSKTLKSGKILRKTAKSRENWATTPYYTYLLGYSHH